MSKSVVRENILKISSKGRKKSNKVFTLKVKVTELITRLTPLHIREIESAKAGQRERATTCDFTCGIIRRLPDVTIATGNL